MDKISSTVENQHNIESESETIDYETFLKEQQRKFNKKKTLLQKKRFDPKKEEQKPSQQKQCKKLAKKRKNLHSRKEMNSESEIPIEPQNLDNKFETMKKYFEKKIQRLTNQLEESTISQLRLKVQLEKLNRQNFIFKVQLEEHRVEQQKLKQSFQEELREKILMENNLLLKLDLLARSSKRIK